MKAQMNVIYLFEIERKRKKPYLIFRLKKYKSRCKLSWEEDQSNNKYTI